MQFLFLLPFVLRLVFPKTVLAVCPICTVAVGAGLGLSRYIGIDDAISGIWIGGLILSSSLWLSDWLSKKKYLPDTQRNQTLVAIGMYILVLGPLWYTNIIGHPFNTILGIDKIIFGSIAGTLTFLAGIWADNKIREKRGKQFINFQKVIFPVIGLILVSLIIYFYGGYLY
jgi:hypothetical protein